MVVQTTTLLSPTSAKLELSSSIGDQSTATSPSSRGSQPRCISLRTYLPVCSPAMEATKALALRLRHRASLRRVNKKNAQAAAEAAAEEYRAQAAHDAYGQRQAAAARRESTKEKRSEDPSDIPAMVPIPDPPATAPASSTASPTTEPTSGAPLTPSPGSDVSPTSQPPPKHAAAAATDPEKAPTESQSPTADYFTLEKLGGIAPDAPSGKITFDIPTKADDVDGLETAVSSASPSTVVSPRGSVDDGATDAGRSSIVSMSGGGSRHSSMNSPVAFLLPNGTLPQGRTRTSVNSRHRDSSPSITSRYVERMAPILGHVDTALISFSFFFCCPSL